MKITFVFASVYNLILNFILQHIFVGINPECDFYFNTRYKNTVSFIVLELEELTLYRNEGFFI